jgi:hypothetical protein
LTRRIHGVAAAGTWFGVVAHPEHARFASLRDAVEDVDGRRSDLMIVHAYRVGR